VILLAAPVALFLYGLTLVVFIVRNFLLFLPFTALFAGLGVAFLVGLSHSSKVRAGLLVGLVILTAFALRDTWMAAKSVADRGQQQLAKLAGQRIMTRDAGVCVRLSPAVKAMLVGAGWRLADDPDAHSAADTTEVLISTYELSSGAPVTLEQWPGTQSQWFEVLGPREVDFSYYPRWSGAERLLALSTSQMVYIGLDEGELQSLGVSIDCASVSTPH